MVAGDIVDRHPLRRRGEVHIVSSRRATEDDEIRHDGARHRRLSRELAPQHRQIVVDVFGR
jgi:hypothetical protein